jgi:hypothetical protein
LEEYKFNSIYTAEHVDNNKENKSWKQVIEVPNPTDKISSQQLPPVRKVKALPSSFICKIIR